MRCSLLSLTLWDRGVWENLSVFTRVKNGYTFFFFLPPSYDWVCTRAIPVLSTVESPASFRYERARKADRKIPPSSVYAYLLLITELQLKFSLLLWNEISPFFNSHLLYHNRLCSSSLLHSLSSFNHACLCISSHLPSVSIPAVRINRASPRGAKKMRERGAVSCCGVWDGVGRPLLSLCSLSVLCVCRVSCSVSFSHSPLPLSPLSLSSLSLAVLHSRAWCCYVYTNQYLRRLMMYVICAYRLVSIEWFLRLFLSVSHWPLFTRFTGHSVLRFLPLVTSTVAKLFVASLYSTLTITVTTVVC